jgi:hypothetical protein
MEGCSVIELPNSQSITGAGRGQGRDTATGRFSRKPGMQGQLLQHLAGPRPTGHALIWSILERSAPRVSGLLQALAGAGVAQGGGASSTGPQNGSERLLR